MKRAFAAFVVLMAGLPVVLWLLPARGDRINPIAFATIQVGMSLDEVIGKLGLVPGDYQSGSWNSHFMTLVEDSDALADFQRPRRDRCEWWNSDEFLIKVWFDQNNLATRKRLFEVDKQKRTRRSLAELIQWRFERLGRRETQDPVRQWRRISY